MLNESIRDNINKTIDEAFKEVKGFEMNLTLKHMLTSICFIMYKSGLNDGFRMSIKAIEISKENMKKE